MPGKTQSKNSCGEPVCVPRLAVASCMQPTTSQDDGEEPQKCLEIDFSCDYESDVGSVESSESDIYDVEIFSDLEVNDAFDVNSEYLATKSETCDQTQVQLGSLRASSFSEQNISSQCTPQQFQIIATNIIMSIYHLFLAMLQGVKAWNYSFIEFSEGYSLVVKHLFC